MCAITHYQKNADLYSHVLENPLILQNIFQHLAPKDSLNLLITNAPFTKEERFLDTLDIFLLKKEREYDIDQMEKKSLLVFNKTYVELENFLMMKLSGDFFVHELVIQMRCVYDHLNENQWFLAMYSSFKGMIEVMLLKHLNHEHFHHDTLFYLGEMFDIFVNAEFDETDGEEIEYIITSYGEKMYLSKNL